MQPSRKEMCFSDLKLRILKTELEPGSDLDEASLASQYGLSRTPLREVLQRLAGGGYLQLAENRGAKVASMDISTLRTFFQTAPMVYANISRLAAENRTEQQLVVLQSVQDEFAKLTRAEEAAAVSLANHRFHALIGEMAHNPYLSASLDRLLIDHTRLSQTFFRPRSDEDSDLVQCACAQHQALIAAIAAQDGTRAVELTLQHWDLSRHRMARFVRPDPLPLAVSVSAEEEHHAI